MKKLLAFVIIFTAFFSLAAYSANVISSKKINITINGVVSHSEYKALVEDLKKIEGVLDLIPSTEKSGTLTLTGHLGEKSDSVKNDIQALAMDRYKFDSKENKEALNVALKKL